MIRPIHLASLLLVAGGCAGSVGGSGENGSGLDCALPGLAHQRVFTGVTIRQPIQLVQPPADATRFFVVEHSGAIKWFASDPATTTANLFLDLSGKVKLIFESGMNGLAFDPGFASNGQVYVTYNATPTHDATLNGVHIVSQWRLSRFTSRDGGLTADPTSEEILIDLDKFADEHNAGKLAFGPDGFLYVSVGDGGPSFDPNHYGQNVNVLFGKFLRLDVHAQARPYGIPSDNPFASGGGKPEIYAWGLRNPWRWSFDRATGDLWAGDVGQDAFEEIDKIVKGGNYGWSIKEANHCYPQNQSCSLPGAIDPVIELAHPEWRSVIGGFVYRGNAIPALKGTYVFGDYVNGRVAGLFTDPQSHKIGVQTLDATGKSISAFAEDQDGELYFLDVAFGGIYKLASGTCQSTGNAPPPPYKFLMRAGTGTETDANAYYASIGAQAGLTLDQWKTDHFADGNIKTGFYRNAMDLGFWREMTCSTTLGRGTGGCAVRNWKNPDDPQNGAANLGTVTMDVSADGFTRFWVFSPDGVLQPFAILDSEGKKAPPYVCNACHGGHYQGAGSSADLGSIFREFEPGLLQERPGITRAQAEQEWFDLNQSIRSANLAIHSEAEGAPLGTDHAKAGLLGYLDELYAQPGPPARDVHDAAHLPVSWQHGGNPSLDGTMQGLWEKLVNPYCMGCHRHNALHLGDYGVFSALAAVQAGQPVLKHYILLDPSPSALQMPQAQLAFNNLQADAAALGAVDDWLIAAQNPAVPLCKVDFEIDHGDFTYWGQDLYVVGDVAELGKWNPQSATHLDGSQWPTWRGSVILPQGENAQWKAIALSQYDRSVVWERGDNHVLTVPNSLHAAVQADWRK